MSPPLSEVELRARLEDRFGNFLDPHRLSCTASWSLVPPRATEDRQACFPIRHVDHGTVDVQVTDSDSRVSTQAVIPFAAAWMEDPGAVPAGSAFRTALYAIPPAGRLARRANIAIEFPSDRAAFLGMDPSPMGSPSLSTKTTVDEHSLNIRIEGEEPVRAEEYPDGLGVGIVIWRCLEGLEASSGPQTTETQPGADDHGGGPFRSGRSYAIERMSTESGDRWPTVYVRL
jgi:hypothetical protein